MSTREQSLHECLKQGRFELLTLVQWEIVIMSVIVEDIMRDASFRKITPPDWVNNFVQIHVAQALEGGGRDVFGAPAVAEVLKESLLAKYRPVFCEALTRFVKNAYETMKKGGDVGLEQAAILVDHGLNFSDHLDGAVRAEVLQEMALDREFLFRREALNGLVGRPFCNSAEPVLWDVIQNQLSWASELTGPVMRHYLEDEDNPFGALQALQHVPKKPETPDFDSTFADAIDPGNELKLSNWDEAVRGLFGELPPWAMEYLKREHPEIHEDLFG